MAGAAGWLDRARELTADRRRVAWVARVVVLALLLVAPWTLSAFSIFLLTQFLIFGLFAASLDLLVGYAGLPSLGHAAFFGTGAYAAGLAATRWTPNAWLMLVSAVAVSIVLAVVTGWLAVRTRGVYFLMLTLAFSQILFSVAITWTPVTGGANGLSVPRTTLWPGEGGELLGTNVGFFYYVVVLGGLAYALLRRSVSSPFGRTLVGLRGNEERMRSLGYPTVGYQLAAYTLAGAVGGIAGAMFVQHTRFVSPGTVGFETSAIALIMVILGGVATLYGPVVGAAVVILLRDELAARFGERAFLLLGLVFVAAVYLLPQGIGGLARGRGRASVGDPAAGEAT